MYVFAPMAADAGRLRQRGRYRFFVTRCADEVGMRAVQRESRVQPVIETCVRPDSWRVATITLCSVIAGMNIIRAMAGLTCCLDGTLKLVIFMTGLAD